MAAELIPTGRADYRFRVSISVEVPAQRSQEEALRQVASVFESGPGRYLLSSEWCHVYLRRLGKITFVSKTDRMVPKARPYINWRTFVRDHAAAKKQVQTP